MQWNRQCDIVLLYMTYCPQCTYLSKGMFTHSLNVTMFSHCCKGIQGHCVDIVLWELLEPWFTESYFRYPLNALFSSHSPKLCDGNKAAGVPMFTVLCICMKHSLFVICAHSGQCVVEAPAESCVLALYVRSQHWCTQGKHNRVSYEANE